MWLQVLLYDSLVQLFFVVTEFTRSKCTAAWIERKWKEVSHETDGFHKAVKGEVVCCAARQIVYHFGVVFSL